MPYFDSTYSSDTSHSSADESDASTLSLDKRYLSNSKRRFTNNFHSDTITELFQVRVLQTPTKPAVHFEGQLPLSYQQLDWSSSTLASTLTIHSGSVIAVCLERSTDLVISLFAILKAGCAYVILDPYASPERNLFIVSDSKAALVLSDHKRRDLFSNALNVETLLGKVQAMRSQQAPALPVILPNALAYIVYTSGSMGKPKGVLISHKAAATGIMHFPLNGRSRWLLFYNPIFSAAQRTILATICRGGCLCLTNQDRLTSELPAVLTDMEIEALGITPTMLSTLSPSMMPESLKLVTTVGEPLGDLDASQWIDHLEEFRISYGLSECAQLNMSRKLGRGDSPNVVGYPSDTTTARILQPGTTDEVFFGESGELCLEGPQLSNGYLNLPEETGKRFVRSPESGSLMFRTGDLARQLSTGSIEILGRIDRQLKINGQRLDPEEIAAVLKQQDSITAVTVVAASINDEKALTAAIACSGSTNWSKLVTELRSRASLHLPAYMVPRYWLRYEVLPRTATGKIDWSVIQRDAESTSIDDLLARSPASNLVHDETTDAVEILIRNTWASNLGIEASSIRRNDSFLSLGGGSMSAIRMISELRKQGITMSLESYFAQETIANAHSRLAAQEDSKLPDSTETKPFSMITDDAMKKVLQDQWVSDAYQATEFQASVVAATLNGSTHYTYQRKWSVKYIDLKRLQLAFHVRFLTNETLRTTFIATDSGLLQAVKNNFSLPWSVLDENVEDYEAKDLKAGFNLGEPMWRAAVLKGTVLIVTMHHALFDFLSHSFLYEDVASLYDGRVPAKRPPFSSFVNHVRQLDQGQARRFWEQHLQEAIPTILNPSPDSKTIHVSQPVSMDLEKTSALANVTASTLIQFVWALVLSKHVRSEDVIFAITMSGREMPLDGIDVLDGPAVTVVPRRVRLVHDGTVGDALRSVQKDSWELLKYSQYGLRKALNAGRCENDIFDTMINILPTKTASRHDTDKIFKKLGDKPTWKTDHTVLQISYSKERIELEISSKMDEQRVNFVLAGFTNVLKQITKNLQQPLQALQILTPGELGFLQRPAKFSTLLPETLLTGFDESVRADPNKVALQWQNIRSITYQELDQKANQLANMLRYRGVKNGDRICLYLDKSPMMLISILGCLKAGTVYVPLSPENPLDRNTFIANDTGSVMILSESTLEDARGLGETVLELAENDLEVFSSAVPKVKITSEDPAYIIYTSGSTGQPKGCLLSHGAAAAAIESMIKFEKRREHDNFRALQFSNYIFDASILDIFNTINSGGTLCMAPTDRLLSDLTGVINEMQVYHSFFTPTVLRLLNPADVPSLKSMSVGGEALSAEVIQAWAKPGYHFMQAYGPTETAMVCVMRSMSADSAPRDLGKPFDTIKAFILDPNGDSLTPYGGVGELCIAGPQVGMGYWKRPDVTSKAFIELDQPMSGCKRLYRSGDLARWLPGGTIEYLGRKDHQVKVHGHRIELGEIEQAILATKSVNDCVTIVANIDKKVQLASFIVFTPGEESGIQPTNGYLNKVQELCADLHGLAHYMIPKYVLPVQAMPLTAGGKADRKKLEKWLQDMDFAQLSIYCFETFGDEMSVGGTSYDPPQSEQERALISGYSTVLGLSPDVKVGRAARFLSLGGDSISAINLTSYMRKQGYALSVADILKYPSLHDLATRLEGDNSINQPSSAQAEDVHVVPEHLKFSQQLLDTGRSLDEVEYTYPCPPGQTEFLEQGSQEGQGWVLMTIRLLQHDVNDWIAIVHKLSEVNDILRTTFIRARSGPVPEWIGVVLKHQSTRPKLDVFDVTPESRDAAIDLIWSHRFSFGEPFIRYALLRHPDGKQEIVTKMDHALYDGTLLRVWAEHFSAIQKQLPVPEHTPFRQFVSHIDRSDKAAALEYWKPQLRQTAFNFPATEPTMSLCADTRVDTPVAVSSLNLTSQSLHKLASAHGVTVSTLFQSAFQLWLSRASGRARSGSTTPAHEVDITYDYLCTGRDVSMADPQTINGTCATFIPLRYTIDLASPIASFLNATQTTFCNAHEHANVGISEIYAAAGLDRTTHGNKVLFLYQPFNPPPKSDRGQSATPEMKYVYMAGAQTKMPQPYALVCEIKKTDGVDHKVQFTYDPFVMTAREAREGVEEIRVIFDRLVKAVEEEGRVADVIEL